MKLVPQAKKLVQGKKLVQQPSSPRFFKQMSSDKEESSEGSEGERVCAWDSKPDRLDGSRSPIAMDAPCHDNSERFALLESICSSSAMASSPVVPVGRQRRGSLGSSSPVAAPSRCSVGSASPRPGRWSCSPPPGRNSVGSCSPPPGRGSVGSCSPPPPRRGLRRHTVANPSPKGSCSPPPRRSDRRHTVGGASPVGRKNGWAMGARGRRASLGSDGSVPSPESGEQGTASCAPESRGSVQRASVLSSAARGSFKSPIEEDAEHLDMRLFLLDNSGSARKNDSKVVLEEGETARVMATDRWCEARALAMAHAEWNVRGGVRCQFVLLNPPSTHSPQEGRDFATVDPKQPGMREQLTALGQVLQKSGPCGNTPLTSRLRQLRQRQEGERNKKRLALVIVTDGLPTSWDSTSSTEVDKDLFLQELHAWAKAFECELVIRLTTNRGSVLSYYQRVAEVLPFRVNVLHNLHGEARKARRCGNGWVAYSPLIQRIREGGASGNALAQLGERELSLQELREVLEFLLRKPDDCRPFPLDAEGMYRAAEKVLPKAAPVYNGRCRGMTPPVDLAKLKQALGLSFSSKTLKELNGMMARAVARLPLQ